MALREITDDSGGRTEIVRDFRDLDPAINSIADELSQQYYIGYPSPGYKDGRWHTIVLGEAQVGARIADQLDVMRLQDAVLEPVLRIGDPRTDKRIDFVGGARGTAELESRVRSGGAAVAFSLYPVDVQDLMAITDAGGIMPPKSTWFEPKLRDGLLSHQV